MPRTDADRLAEIRALISHLQEAINDAEDWTVEHPQETGDE